VKKLKRESRLIEKLESVREESDEEDRQVQPELNINQVGTSVDAEAKAQQARRNARA